MIKKRSETLSIEKDKLEEDLLETKLALEDAKREIESLQSEKEGLESYVNQLADDMEKETSQMVSMKQQFEVETKVLTGEIDMDSIEQGQGNGSGGNGGNGGIGGSPNKDASKGMKAKKPHHCVELSIKEEELRTANEELKKVKQRLNSEKRNNESQVVMLKVEIRRGKEALKTKENSLAQIEEKIKEMKLVCEKSLEGKEEGSSNTMKTTCVLYATMQ